MENIVAVTLFRKYGHDRDNERVFFYNSNVEVDFYIPEAETAIQVSYSISANDSTYEREITALLPINKKSEAKTCCLRSAFSVFTTE